MGEPADRGEVYCTDCGELMDTSARYCSYCGEPLQANVNRAVIREEKQRDEPPDSYIPEAHHAKGDRYTDRLKQNNQARKLAADQSLSSRIRAIGASFGIGLGSLTFLGVVGVFGVILGILFQLPDAGLLGLGAVMGYTLGFVGLGLLYMFYRGYTLVETRDYIGLKLPETRELGYVVVGNIAIVLTLVGFISFVDLLAGLPEPAVDQTAREQISTSLYLAVVAFMFFIVGPAEEIIFRGVIQSRLREQFSALSAILLSSSIFTLLHIQIYTVGAGTAGAVIGFVILFVPAMIFGYLFERTGNVLIPSLIHGIHNSLIITILLYGPDYLVQFTSVGG